jgi:hypothetical protein
VTLEALLYESILDDFSDVLDLLRFAAFEFQGGESELSMGSLASLLFLGML